jgi:hypothetical protein
MIYTTLRAILGGGNTIFFNFSVGCGGLLKINSVGGDPMTRKFSG